MLLSIAAMKKRSIESVSKLSSGSKRLNRSKTGIESFKDLVIKKENQETVCFGDSTKKNCFSKNKRNLSNDFFFFF